MPPKITPKPRTPLTKKHINNDQDTDLSTPSKCVKFSSTILETSYGGTKTPVNMKRSSLPPNPDVESSKLSHLKTKLTHSPVRHDNARSDASILFQTVNSPASTAANTPFKTPRSVYKTPVKQHIPTGRVSETPDCFNYVALESPRTPRARSHGCLGNSYHGDLDREDSVVVAVRVRPFTAREKSDPNLQCVVEMHDNRTTVSSLTGQQFDFAYDFSFWSFDKSHEEFADQEHTYKMVAKPLLGKAYQGYNTCLFAYGQTGSGKSFTMMGESDQIGIIPRFCEELFIQKETSTDSVNVEISYFEIYNEKIHDLLGSHSDSKKEVLKVREDPETGPYVVGLSNYMVNSYEDIQYWINLGNKQRATASTGMNDKSSRSHSVFTIVLTQTKREVIQGETHEHFMKSSVSLVDLAGSERQGTANTSTQHLREGSSINKSLLALGKVINTLSEQSTLSAAKKQKLFIPYRDSVLTWLLRESLGGNSKTAMIATISPANLHMEETLSTLRYAKQARSIVNSARINEDPNGKIIRELQAEIERLRSLKSDDTSVESIDDRDLSSSQAEINSLKEQLRFKEQEMQDAKRLWREKLKSAEEQKLHEARLLEKCGVSLNMDNSLPNLVNLNEDAQLSETLQYSLKQGQTKVGRKIYKSVADVQLTGSLIAHEHCVFENDGNLVRIAPLKKSAVYVNGQQILDKTTLNHGDRVILGTDHYFRFCHPEVISGQRSSAPKKDFDFAKNELIAAQNAKLQAEVETVKKEAEKNMAAAQEAKKQARQELRLQRKNYEDSLQQLEKSLMEKSNEMQMSHQNRQQAQEVIDQLEHEKKNLKAELESTKIRQQLEENSASKVKLAEKQCNDTNSRLMVHLAKQKAILDKEVARLEALKERRQAAITRAMTSDSCTNVNKIESMVKQANKISAQLKKDTVFTKDELTNNKVLIKVTNNWLGVTTFWTLDKFVDRLDKMRHSVEGQDDDVAMETEADVELAYPRENKQHGQEIFDDESNCATMITIDTCQEIIAETISGTNENHKREVSVVDVILQQCERLKSSIVSVLDQHEQSGKAENQVISRMTVAYTTLYHRCSSWIELSIAKSEQPTNRMKEFIHKMGKLIVLFLQSCKNEQDSMVQESASQILDSIFNLCKVTGEVSMATEMGHVTMIDHSQRKLGHDIRQAFISGCDTFIDKMLQTGIKQVEDSRFQIQTLADEYSGSTMRPSRSSSGHLQEILENCEIISATTLILLIKLQEAQIDVDSSMRESSIQKPDDFYEEHYKRLRHMKDKLSLLLDDTENLTQTVLSLHNRNTGYLDMNTEQLLSSADGITAGFRQLVLTAESNDCNTSDTSILSTTQQQQLEMLVQDVQLAVGKLKQLVSTADR